MTSQNNWISVKTQLPENDTKVVLWVDNDMHPHWSGEKLGSYQNEKFYGVGGIDTSCETVTHWFYLPQPPTE